MLQGKPGYLLTCLGCFFNYHYFKCVFFCAKTDKLCKSKLCKFDTHYWCWCWFSHFYFSFHCVSYQCVLIPIEDDERTVWSFTLKFWSEVFYGKYFNVCKTSVCGWTSEYIIRLFNCRGFAQLNLLTLFLNLLFQESLWEWKIISLHFKIGGFAFCYIFVFRFWRSFSSQSHDSRNSFWSSEINCNDLYLLFQWACFLN